MTRQQRVSQLLRLSPSEVLEAAVGKSGVAEMSGGEEAENRGVRSRVEVSGHNDRMVAAAPASGTRFSGHAIKFWEVKRLCTLISVDTTSTRTLRSQVLDC